MRRHSIDFAKALQKNKILLQFQIKNYEMKMIAEFHTGYAYALDFDEEHMNNFISSFKDK